MASIANIEATEISLRELKDCVWENFPQDYFTNQHEFVKNCIWTDGTNYYYSDSTANATCQYIIDEENHQWIETTWNITNLKGEEIWVDGNNIYYKNTHYLDKAEGIWKEKNWINGQNISGTKIFYLEGDVYSLDNNNKRFVKLDRENDKWIDLPYNVEEIDSPNFNGTFVWVANNIAYFSNDSQQYWYSSEAQTWYKYNTAENIGIGLGHRKWYSFIFNDEYYWWQNKKLYKFNIYDRQWEQIFDVPATWIDGLSYPQQMWNIGENYYYLGNKSIEVTYANVNHNLLDIEHREKNITDYEGVHNLRIKGDGILQYKNNETNQWLNVEYEIPLMRISRRAQRKHFVPIDVNPTNDDYKPPYGEQVFYINNNTYYFYGAGSNNAKIYRFNSDIKKWEKLNSTFSQSLNLIEGRNVWSDGENTYYGLTHKINDIDAGSFSEISIDWSGSDGFRGEYVWSDGGNIRYNTTKEPLIFNKNTKNWALADWGTPLPCSNNIWTDGYNIYDGWDYKLNISEYEWETIDRSGSGFSGQFNGYYVWSDGEDIYHTHQNKTYKLDIFTQKWYEVPLFEGIDDHSHEGCHIWTDFQNIYYTDTWTNNEPVTYILKDDSVLMHDMI